MTVQADQTFGELLRTFRERAGLTQEALAERAGLSVDAIGLLERGARRHPQRHTVQQLVASLGLLDQERTEFEVAAHRRGRAALAPLLGPGRSVLPLLPTSFVGRVSEVTDVMRMLDAPSSRLVTLTGPGGIGKTRLALEVASRLADHFADGAVFVPLAAVPAADLVLEAIARVLDIRTGSTESLSDSLSNALRERAVLLILDNCEHLLSSAPFVANLIAVCPQVVVLATSRRPLRISVEQQYPVAPLAVPEVTRATDLDVLRYQPAVMLFTHRAKAIMPDFALAPSTAVTAAAICRRLDGLPLAIELAAAWIKVLSPDALLARLEQVLPLLTGGPRDQPARQQTLRATIAWSYDLLAPHEQRLLRCLAAFDGTWTLDAAQVVCLRDDISSSTILANLASLVDASLVQRFAVRDVDAGEPRYAMLATVREYAEELLEASDEGDVIHRRHAWYVLELIENAQPHLVGPDEGVWLARLEEESPNVRVALRSVLDARETEMAVRFAAVLWRFWATRGHLEEGRRWLDEILMLIVPNDVSSKAASEIPPLRRAMVLHITANLTRVQGDYERADALYLECLAIRRNHNDVHGVMGALHNLGITAYERGDYTRAIRLHEQALPLAMEVEDPYGIAFILTTFGETMHAAGDVERAVVLYEEGLAGFRRIQHTWGIALALTRLGDAALAQGNHARATALHLESLRLSVSLHDPRAAADTLDGLARIASRNAPEHAARLLGTADMLRGRFGFPRSPARRSDYDEVVGAVCSTLGDMTLSVAYREGAMSTLDHALTIAEQDVE